MKNTIKNQTNSQPMNKFSMFHARISIALLYLFSSISFADQSASDIQTISTKHGDLIIATSVNQQNESITTNFILHAKNINNEPISNKFIPLKTYELPNESVIILQSTGGDCGNPCHSFVIASISDKITKVSEEFGSGLPLNAINQNGNTIEISLLNHNQKTKEKWTYKNKSLHHTECRYIDHTHGHSKVETKDGVLITKINFEAESGRSENLYLNDKKVEHIAESYGMSIFEPFELHDRSIVLLIHEGGQGTCNCSTSYQFITIKKGSITNISKQFSGSDQKGTSDTGYPASAITLSGSTITITIPSMGGRNDQQWTYEDDQLIHTIPIDFSIEQQAARIFIKDDETPAKVHGSIQKAINPNEGENLYEFHFDKKTLITGNCDSLVDSIPLIAETIPAKKSGFFEATIWCGSGGNIGISSINPTER